MKREDSRHNRPTPTGQLGSTQDHEPTIAAQQPRDTAPEEDGAGLDPGASAMQPSRPIGMRRMPRRQMPLVEPAPQPKR